MQKITPFIVLFLVTLLASCSEQSMLAESEAPPIARSTSSLSGFDAAFCDDLDLPTPQAGNGELQLQLCASLGSPGLPLSALVTVRSFLPYTHTVEGYSNSDGCWHREQFNWTGFVEGKENTDEDYDDVCNPTSGNVLKFFTTYMVTVENDDGGDDVLGPTREAAFVDAVRDRFFFRFLSGVIANSNTPDIFALWKDGEFQRITEPNAASGYFFPSESDWNSDMPKEHELQIWQGVYAANGLTAVGIDNPLAPFPAPQPYALSPHPLDWTPFTTMKGDIPAYTTTGKHLKVFGRIKPGTIKTIEVFDAVTVCSTGVCTY